MSIFVNGAKFHFFDVPEKSKNGRKMAIFGTCQKTGPRRFFAEIRPILGVKNDPKKGHLQPIRRPQAHF